MTEVVEGQPQSTQEQPPADQAVVSEGKGEQLSQAGSQDVVSRADLEKLASELRGLQSKQDKSESGFTNKFIETPQELGMQISDAQKTELRFRALETQTAPIEQSTVSAVQAQEPADYAQVVNSLGLNPGDNDVITAIANNMNDAKSLKEALVDLKLNQTSQPVTTGAVQPSGIQTQPQSADVSRLITEFDKLSTMSLSKRLPGGQTVRERRLEIDKELQEAQSK